MGGGLKWAANFVVLYTKDRYGGWMDEQKDESNPQGFCCDNTDDALSCRGSSKKGRTRNEFYGLMGYGSAWAGVLLLLFGYEKNRGIKMTYV